MSDARVVVVGGGIAGLTVAHRLLHPHAAVSAQDSIQVTVLEAEPRFGGKIRTELVDGFVVDAGPDSFLTTRPAALELATELGLADTLVRVRILILIEYLSTIQGK